MLTKVYFVKSLYLNRATSETLNCDFEQPLAWFMKLFVTTSASVSLLCVPLYTNARTKMFFLPQVKTDIKKRVREDSDFNSQQFPNTHRAFSPDS